jgi:hypothetical protein
MAHPQRERMVAELELRLDREAEVVWDRRDVEWDTGRRALLAHTGLGADYALVVQDDAIPCRDLLAGVESALDHAAGQPIGLYAGLAVQAPPSFPRLVARCLDTKTPWFRARGPIWGVCIAVPSSDVSAIVAHGDRDTATPDYDAKIERYYRRRGVECLYPIPSLVEHRRSPSLLGKSPERRAQLFIGAEASAADIDWSIEPLAVDGPVRFRNRLTGREREVESDSEPHRRFACSRQWEEI